LKILKQKSISLPYRSMVIPLLVTKEHALTQDTNVWQTHGCNTNFRLQTLCAL